MLCVLVHNLRVCLRVLIGVLEYVLVCWIEDGFGGEEELVCLC